MASSSGTEAAEEEGGAVSGVGPMIVPPSSSPAESGTGHDTAPRSEELQRFVDAVSPFVRDVLDEPFPWKHAGMVMVALDRAEYDEAVAALEALRD